MSKTTFKRRGKMDYDRLQRLLESLRNQLIDASCTIADIVTLIEKEKDESKDIRH